MPEKQKPQPGDYVEVHLSKIIYEGILLETPESEKGIVLLKLGSGYNVGFNKKDILQIKFVKRVKSPEKEFEPPKSSEKPNIAMIITGGTIASKYDAKTGGVSNLLNSEDLFRYYPEMFEKANVARVEVPFMKSSEDMDFRDWQKVAKIAEKLLNDGSIKGIIIPHGTDTLHYTSAALGFFLRNLNKPVVLTYSQRSADRGSSDANLNLQCSALAAISDIAEVMLVGHATTNDDFCYAMPGTKVRKMHSSRRDAFKAINSKPLAKIFPDRIEIMSNFHSRQSHHQSPAALPSELTNKKNPQNSSIKNNKVKIDSAFEEKVALIKVYPGQNTDILDYYLKNKYKGIVIEATGLGHVPSAGARNSWLKKLKEIQQKGIVVCIASQTIFGRVDPFVYSNARALMETGAIFLEDMLSETALVKLGWILGHKDWAKSKKTVREKMLENFSHELNRRLRE